MFAWITHGRPALVSLLIGSAVLSDGFIQSASAQCPPSSKIYIDPRLVPRRPHIPEDLFRHVQTDPNASPEYKKWVFEHYMNEYQPIQMPFRNGYVLISGADPCIQQYIGP